jgi:ABC-type glycerol-3-phosphate transport system permease component
VCGAWLLYATEALGGNPNWVTVPVGITILAAVELARWDMRTHEASPTEPLVLLEYGGLACLVSASLFETVSDSVFYGLLALGLGVAVVGWAAFTRVRRRMEVGGATILLALLLMLTVPVIRLVPHFRGAELWGAVAALGMILLVLATTLEQSRTRLRSTVHRLDQLMVGWE